MANGDSEYVRFEETRRKRLVRGLVRYLKSPAFRDMMGQEAVEIVKYRTWTGEDSSGKPFIPLQKNYADWKEKRRPGKRILFFDDDMVTSLSGTMVLTDSGDGTATPGYFIGVPKSKGWARFKEYMHEERGIKRGTAPYTVRRQFTSLQRKELRVLDSLLRSRLADWVLSQPGVQGK